MNINFIGSVNQINSSNSLNSTKQKISNNQSDINFTGRDKKASKASRVYATAALALAACITPTALPAAAYVPIPEKGNLVMGINRSPNSSDINIDYTGMKDAYPYSSYSVEYSIDLSNWEQLNDDNGNPVILYTDENGNARFDDDIKVPGKSVFLKAKTSDITAKIQDNQITGGLEFTEYIIQKSTDPNNPDSWENASDSSGYSIYVFTDEFGNAELPEEIILADGEVLRAIRTEESEKVTLLSKMSDKTTTNIGSSDIVIKPASAYVPIPEKGSLEMGINRSSNSSDINIDYTGMKAAYPYSNYAVEVSTDLTNWELLLDESGEPVNLTTDRNGNARFDDDIKVSGKRVFLKAKTSEITANVEDNKIVDAIDFTEYKIQKSADPQNPDSWEDITDSTGNTVLVFTDEFGNAEIPQEISLADGEVLRAIMPADEFNEAF